MMPSASSARAASQKGVVDRFTMQRAVNRAIEQLASGAVGLLAVHIERRRDNEDDGSGGREHHASPFLLKIATGIRHPTSPGAGPHFRRAQARLPARKPARISS